MKRALLSANPRMLSDLKTCTDRFLLDYRVAVRTATEESPTALFKSRRQRGSWRCLGSSDVTHFRGTKPHSSSARGIKARQLDQSVFEIIDLNDAPVH